MKILGLMFPNFTAIDLIGPINSWSLLPGYELQLAAKSAGPVPTDTGAAIIATHSFTDCWQAPDVLLVPGGGRPVFHALEDDALLDVVADIGSRAGWVTSVCNGSLLLGAAGLLEGYDAGCYWYSRDYLKLFGANPVNGRVVIDRNRATGGGMTAGVDFGLRMIGEWHGEGQGQAIELCMEYAPQPPYGTGLPELAPPPVLEMVSGMLAGEMPNEVAVATARRRGFTV